MHMGPLGHTLAGLCIHRRLVAFADGHLRKVIRQDPGGEEASQAAADDDGMLTTPRPLGELCTSHVCTPSCALPLNFCGYCTGLHATKPLCKGCHQFCLSVHRQAAMGESVL